jgi:hypothetical protein
VLRRLTRHEPLCLAYNALHAPGRFRVWGQSFNFTQPDDSAFTGRGVVITASGNITRYGPKCPPTVGGGS